MNYTVKTNDSLQINYTLMRKGQYARIVYLPENWVARTWSVDDIIVLNMSNQFMNLKDGSTMGYPSSGPVMNMKVELLDVGDTVTLVIGQTAGKTVFIPSEETR
jgi:hypothetical protein